MKRPIWTVLVATAATLTLGMSPARATTSAPALPATNPVQAPAAAPQGGPVDPPLFDRTAGGDTVRVNVVTQNRGGLAAAATAGTTVQEFSKLPVVTLKVDKGGLAKLSTQAGVVSVTEDVPVAPSLDVSVPQIGGNQPIKAGVTGKGSAIAVLDTGVATAHPFFKGRIIAEACFSPVDAAYGASSLCPDGSPRQEGPGTADSERGPCVGIAECDHGTHVAGIAAGNGAGIAGAPASGVAPGADLIAVQIFSRFDSVKWCGAENTPCVRSFTSAQIAALERLAEMRRAGTPVIAANLSLGGGAHEVACDTDARKPAIDSLLAAGAVTVVAAGNNRYPSMVNSPACVSTAVAVGSVTVEDEVSAYSNHGPLLDVFAPGDDIVSSVRGGGFQAKSGTSMATPHVAGAFAVLRQAHPDKDIAALQALLKTTGRVVTEAGVSVPRIDVARAVKGTQPTPPPAPEPKPLSSTVVNPTAFPIPNPGTVRSPIVVTDFPGNAPKTVQVRVDLAHEWRGEVRVDLRGPDGRMYPLKGNGPDNAPLPPVYTVDVTGSPAVGTWTLVVEDRYANAVGTLRSWSLTLPTPFRNPASAPIPDGGSLLSEIPVSGVPGKAAGALRVAVDLTHEWSGDLRLDLLAPDGSALPLRSASATDDPLPEFFTVNASALTANGTWKLRVQDGSEGAVGTLKGWTLTFPSYETQVDRAIPDGGNLTSPVTVEGIPGKAPNALRVYVDLTHQYLGDVEIYLVDPTGVIRSVKPDSATEGGGTLRRVYTVDAGAAPASGTWKLGVNDDSAGSTGTLAGWSLTF
ncbi:proprotein convertase P-domain-containing protein (plasmid) [Streptomyces sp. BI20]|uniref:proprotein convertase P-domain-containing protein n=1 Tax=Streptomyces sp. BI20 TaxID=3403460 RepID=UPI003C7806D3